MGGLPKFPAIGSVPQKFLPSPEVSFNTPGWPGPFEDIYSPILRDGHDKIKLGRYQKMDEATALDALSRAKKAYNLGRGDWPQGHVSERIDCIEKFSSELQKSRDQIVNMIMWEICKTYPDACKEFDRTIEYIENTIEAAKDLDHKATRFEKEQGIFAQIRRAPLGVTLIMGPYNYPLNETLGILIPALIMGNVVIMKPPKIGVLLFEPVIKAFNECFPEGVVNIISGDGPTIVTPIMTSGDIDVLAFIGSSGVAHRIKASHPKLNRLRCILGLDAKNPGIITSSTDLNTAIPECLTGALSFNGQRCTALKIFFVHKKILGEFLEKMTDGIENLVGGMPWENGAQITPLAEPNKVDSLNSLVDDAILKGAELVNPSGGMSIGTFYSPALINNVTKDMRLYHEEQFGPIVPVVPYEDMNQILDYVSESQFGQQASIFSTNPEAIGEYVDMLINQVCRININSQCQRGPDSFPFTGRKNSAEGTLSTTDALRVFSIRSVVSFKGTDQNKSIVQSVLRRRMCDALSTDYLL